VHPPTSAVKEMLGVLVVISAVAGLATGPVYFRPHFRPRVEATVYVPASKDTVTRDEALLITL
jgi:hypothetical protein